jgi:thioredoxin-related protein
MLVIALLLFAKKKLINNDDKKLILFVIDMYLSYGDSLDIFPNEKSKNILINKIKILKNKLEDDANNRKIDNEE